MKVRAFLPNDAENLVHLIAQFRVELARLRGVHREPNLEVAQSELSEYQERHYPIFVAEEEDSRIIGYLVCRVEDDVVWVESLFVQPEHRRRGAGSALYEKAEQLAQELGGDAPYNWVHPNNDRIINFLRKRGYRVLNLIELRRPWPGENITQKLRVGEYEFDY